MHAGSPNEGEACRHLSSDAPDRPKSSALKCAPWKAPPVAGSRATSKRRPASTSRPRTRGALASRGARREVGEAGGRWAPAPARRRPGACAAAARRLPAGCRVAAAVRRGPPSVGPRLAAHSPRRVVRRLWAPGRRIGPQHRRWFRRRSSGRAAPRSRCRPPPTSSQMPPSTCLVASRRQVQGPSSGPRRGRQASPQRWLHGAPRAWPGAWCRLWPSDGPHRGRRRGRHRCPEEGDTTGDDAGTVGPLGEAQCVSHWGPTRRGEVKLSEVLKLLHATAGPASSSRRPSAWLDPRIDPNLRNHDGRE